jgi:hypothetical protein
MSHPKVRSITHRFGNNSKPFARQRGQIYPIATWYPVRIGAGHSAVREEGHGAHRDAGVRKASDKEARCSCGQSKCHHYDIIRFDQYLARYPKIRAKPMPAEPEDYHIDCGDEDGMQCNHKNGPNPVKPGVTIDSYPAAHHSPPRGYTVETIYTDKYYCCS